GQPGVSIDVNGTITISQPGSYYLTGNLVITATVDGLVINADATVDLNGFGIIGTGAAITTGRGVGAARGNVVHVANGFINGGTTYIPGGAYSPAGFNYGVFARHASTASMTLSDLRVKGTRLDAITVHGSASATRCHVRTVGGSGINLGPIDDSAIYSASTPLSRVSECIVEDAGGRFGINAGLVSQCYARSRYKNHGSSSSPAGAIYGQIIEHSSGVQ